MAVHLDAVDQSRRRRRRQTRSRPGAPGGRARARREKISKRWISAPPACGFWRSCQLASRIFRGYSRPRSRATRSSTPLMNAGAVAPANRCASHSASSITTLAARRRAAARRSRCAGCCARSWRSARAASCRPPPAASASMRGLLGADPLDQRLDVVDDQADFAGQRAQRRRRSTVGRRVAGDLQRVEQLQRPGARRVSARSITRPAPGESGRPSAAPPRRLRAPCCPPAPPARATACSIVSQVSRPKPTGTSASVAARAERRGGLAGDVLEVRRLAANHDAQRHDRGVPPAVRRRRGDDPSSNAPVTQSTSTSASGTPASRQATIAPSSRRAVIRSW